MSKDLPDRLREAANALRERHKQAFVPAPQQQQGPPPPPPPMGGQPPSSPPPGGGDIIGQMAQTIAGDAQVAQMLMQAPDQFMAQVPQVTPDMIPQLQAAVGAMMGGGPQAGPPPPQASTPAPPPQQPQGAPAGGMDPNAMQAIQKAFADMGGQLSNMSTYIEDLGRRLAQAEARAQQGEISNAKNQATLEHLGRQFAIIQAELSKPPPSADMAPQPGTY